MSFSSMKINLNTFNSNDFCKKLELDSSDILSDVKALTDGDIVFVENFDKPVGHAIHGKNIQQIIIVINEKGDDVFAVNDFAYISWHHGCDPSLLDIIVQFSTFMNDTFESNWRYGTLVKK